MSSSTSTAKPLRAPIAPGDSAGYDRFIDQQVEKTGVQVKLFDLCSSLMVLGAGVLSFLLIVTVLDHWVVPLGVGGRWAALALLAGGSGCYLVLVVLPLLLGRVNPLFAARTIEQSEPALKNSLINFLLFRSDRAGVRAVVYQALEQRAATDLKHVPLETAVDRSGLIRIGCLLAGVLAICAAYTILAPKSPFQSISRILAPGPISPSRAACGSRTCSRETWRSFRASTSSSRPTATTCAAASRRRSATLRSTNSWACKRRPCSLPPGPCATSAACLPMNRASSET